MVVGDRQRDGGLAVRLLAELPAILMRHADRMGPVLGKARVVEDPGLDWPVPLDLRQHHVAHLGQHHLVRPHALRHEMQQRLVLRPHTLRRRRRRDRLDTLAFAWKQQARAVVAHRPDAARMPHHACKLVEIVRKTPSAVARSLSVHGRLPLEGSGPIADSQQPVTMSK